MKESTVKRHTEVFVNGKTIKTDQPYYNLQAVHSRLKSFVSLIEKLDFGHGLSDDAQYSIDKLIEETYFLQSDFEIKREDLD